MKKILQAGEDVKTRRAKEELMGLFAPRYGIHHGRDGNSRLYWSGPGRHKRWTEDRDSTLWLDRRQDTSKQWWLLIVSPALVRHRRGFKALPNALGFQK